jgi:hypothetical protein
MSMPNVLVETGQVCPVCKGSGVVEDTTIMTRCLTCNGTGREAVPVQVTLASIDAEMEKAARYWGLLMNRAFVIVNEDGDVCLGTILGPLETLKAQIPLLEKLENDTIDKAPEVEQVFATWLARG